MKKTIVLLLFLISLFACFSTVFAEDASELIGTITCYVEAIQQYPEAIRDACGTDMYQQKLSEMANLITAANDAMADAKLPNTLNLWAVYGAVTSHSSDCSFFDSALSKANWSREELDRIGYRSGLLVPGQHPGLQCGPTRPKIQTPFPIPECNPGCHVEWFPNSNKYDCSCPL